MSHKKQQEQRTEAAVPTFGILTEVTLACGGAENYHARVQELGAALEGLFQSLRHAALGTDQGEDDEAESVDLYRLYELAKIARDRYRTVDEIAGAVRSAELIPDGVTALAARGLAG